jgi:hypothetical protein
VALDLSGLGGLASATPWGAAASALSAAVNTPNTSAATAGPVGSGPKVINVAGFGSKASGSASQSLTQAEPDRGDAFPLSTVGGSVGGFDVPPWVIPAAGALLLLAIVVALARRK